MLSVRGIRKQFGAVRALTDVDLEFRAGEIHALLGENGAGKSTLMNILDGVQRPDGGTIVMDGRPVRFSSPRAARAAGIGMVHQHFTLVEAMTVAENLALGLPGLSRWRFEPRRAAAQAKRLAAQAELDIGSPDELVAHLPVGTRQRLEIFKALGGSGRVLILDEPTAVLTPAEASQLFTLMRALRAGGRAIVFITHKLAEVSAVADRVTVLRRGRVVATSPVAEITERQMAEQMIGEALPAGDDGACGPVLGDVALCVRGLGVAGADGNAALSGVEFDVRAGEILGIAGVDGNGQRELFEALVGLRRPSAGSIQVGGTPVDLSSPAAAHAAGIGHIPPDRQHEGLALSMSVAENFLLNRRMLERFRRRGFLAYGAARELAARLARAYSIRFATLDSPVRSLSGGNQQRVIVARELAQQPGVLVTVNPTRGLDVHAALGVAQALREVARQGCAVVLVSTDLDEVLGLGHRVRVLFRGRLSAALEPPVDTERLGLLMAGGAPAEAVR